jgi:hypothetical protein
MVVDSLHVRTAVEVPGPLDPVERCVKNCLAASYLRHGSVMVLNGHIYQILQVEGSVYFHTAASTAFPQPAPGAGPGRDH